MLKHYIFLFIFIINFSSLVFASSKRETPIVKVVKENGPAVVNISTEQIVLLRESPGWGSYGSDFDVFFDSFFGLNRRTRALKLDSVGSGVILDKSGLIVTNAHVVHMATNIYVILDDGSSVPGLLVFEDLKNDLALIKIETEVPLVEIKLADPNDIMMGETAVAIGNPLGLESSVSAGIISGKNREFYAMSSRPMLKGLLQTDAPINPGNSGGALLNLDGELMGINVAVVQNSQSIGFAIPVDKVENALVEYRTNPTSKQKKVKKYGIKRRPQRQMPQTFDQPSHPFDQIRDFIDRSMGDVDLRLDGQGAISSPKIQIQEKDDQYIVEFDISSIDKDSLKIDIKKGQLSISGKQEQQIDRQEDGSYYSSRSYSSFHKSSTLPLDADHKKMDSELKDDMLIITIPKR